MLELLLSHGAHVNDAAYDSGTALMRAAKGGTHEENRACMQTLMKLCLRNSLYFLILFKYLNYVSVGHIEATKLLLSKGANVDDKDDYGHTALMRAAIGGIVATCMGAFSPVILSEPI